MGEILKSVMSPLLSFCVMFFLLLCILIWILCIVWTKNDSKLRGLNSTFWAAISAVPVAGIIAYLLLRPSLFKIDSDEQKLEVALKKRELAKFGECAKCGYPIEADFILCPHCKTRLRKTCVHCGRVLEPAWDVCPYCGQPQTTHASSIPSATITSGAGPRRTTRQRSTVSATSNDANEASLGSTSLDDVLSVPDTRRTTTGTTARSTTNTTTRSATSSSATGTSVGSKTTAAAAKRTTSARTTK